MLRRTVTRRLKSICSRCRKPLPSKRRMLLEPLEDRSLLSLLGLVPGVPQIAYDSSGTLNYNADAQELSFSIDATPLMFRESATSPPRMITPPRDFLINVQVDNQGQLIGGVDGPDLVITGNLDIDANGTVDYSGTLLTAEVTQFGYYDSGSTTDMYDFRFTPTGGELASFYAGKDIAMITNSEGSTFTGDFTVNFSGYAKGAVGATDALWSSLSGYVYNDANGDGAMQTGESGIEGVAVTLSGSDIGGNPVSAATTTDSLGAYAFPQLRPGTYTITETQPTGAWLDGIDAQGTPGTGTTGNDVFTDIALQVGVDGQDNNFGETAMLTGFDMVKMVTLSDGTPIGNVLVNTPISWTFQLTNPGNVPLSNISLADTGCATIDGPTGDLNVNGLLDVGETWLYAATGIALPGAQINTATATAQATDSTGGIYDLTAQDSAEYFGVQPVVAIEKLTNGTDNAYVALGDPVAWTYTISNAGNVPLANITVSDDQGVVPAYQSGDDNADGLLDVAEVWIYTAAGVAESGDYVNEALVTATDVLLNTMVAAVASSGYFGVDPGIAVEKLTNGESNPNIAVGDAVTWTYTVSNTGNVALADVSVSDDQGVVPVYQSGDDNADGLLDLTEVWTYAVGGTAIAGVYVNTATASGADLTLGATVSDVASSGYFGVDPGIAVEKLTNGESYPNVEAGSQVAWTYYVTNTGNVSLQDVQVTDSDPAVVPFLNGGDDNANGLLDTSETWVFGALGTAVVGDYSNTAAVTATDELLNATLAPVEASSGYFGVAPAIQVVKYTNGLDNANAYIVAGDMVTWTYAVTNTGNVALDGIVVTDDDATLVLSLTDNGNGDDLLDVGETWVFSAVGTAVAGQYENTATALGFDATDTVATEVSASESDGYYGVQTGIELVKMTNGTDNNAAPGAQVTVGDAITWTYNVTNTGTVALADVTVTDSDPAVLPVYQSGDDDGDNLLDIDEMWVYAATGTAIAGQYSNTAATQGTDTTGTVSEPATASDVDYYFGAAQTPATKSGYVYIDANNDGIKQADEEGIRRVKIILTGVNDLGQSVYVCTRTDADGYYQFSGLRPGTYAVREIQPTNPGGNWGWGGWNWNWGSGCHDTYLYQWCEGGVWHYEVQQTGGFSCSCYGSSNSRLIDSLYRELGSNDWLDDALDWEDDGLKDLLFRGCDPSQGEGDDWYFAEHFADFWNGVTVCCNHGAASYYLDGKDTAGTDGGIAGNDIIENIVLDWGDNGTDNNFGELLPASVSGTVFTDNNNDGVQQWDEKGISRVKVTLTGTDDLGNAVQLTTITSRWGTYEFGNLRPGTYTITETQPMCYLDGKDAVGLQGGTVGNDVLSDIILNSGVKAAGNTFGELKAASLSGFVYLDTNGNGDIDCRDRAIADVTVTLSGIDDLGNSVSMTTVTDEDGAYAFKSLRPGTYQIAETQPEGYLDGADFVGSLGGVVGNDVLSDIVTPQGAHGANYNFSELPDAGATLQEGQTATIGFWNNKRGQALIKSLNGGPCSTQLGNWLAFNFPHMYGALAGPHNLAGKMNFQIASYFKQLFRVHGMKIDAQAMAVALACYVTNANLAGSVAASYGFAVSAVGTGAATFNVGDAGEALGVANGSVLSIMTIMQKTDDHARRGILWDLNANGWIGYGEHIMRCLANDLFTDINETGDIG